MKDFYLPGLWANVLCLRELSQAQAVRERLLPIDVTSLTGRVAMVAGQLVDGVTENKWGVFSWCWYGEEGAN